MAVIMAPRGGGLFGALGPILGIGGTMFGAPWMSALGTGITAVNSAMNGNPGDLASAMSGMMNGDFGGMQNPTAGNIAMREEDAELAAWRDAMLKQRQRQNWGW